VAARGANANVGLAVFVSIAVATGAAALVLRGSSAKSAAASAHTRDSPSEDDSTLWILKNIELPQPTPQGAQRLEQARQHCVAQAPSLNAASQSTAPPPARDER
jgi:hypothetical protein